MQLLRFIFISIVISQILGCETAKVWSEKSDDKYVEVVPKNEEDVEVALKESGKKYYCNKLYKTTYPNNKICYVKVDDDIKVKLYKTPKALITDVGNTIVIVGEITLQMFAQGDFGRGN